MRHRLISFSLVVVVGPLSSLSIGGCAGEAVTPDLGHEGNDAGPPDLATLPDLEHAPPVLTSLTPAAGPTTAQTSLVLSGMNFVDGATVSIGGQAATSVVVTSPTQMLAVAEPRPGKPGAVDVTIKNPDGRAAVLASGFTYQLSSLSFAMPSKTYPTGGTSSWTALAVDLDKDGHVDVVTCNIDNGTISVLMGKSDGSFLAPFIHKTGTKPVALAAGDLNGDGFPDVVSADYAADADGLYLNDGAGRLQPRLSIPFPAMTSPVAVALSDVNGDGKADIVTAARGGPSLVTCLNAGSGTFQAPTSTMLAQALPGALLVARIAPDPNPVAIVGYAQGSMAGLLPIQNGGGFAMEKALFVGGTQTGFAAADLNGDKLNDLVVVSVAGTQAQVLLGKVDGLSAPQGYDAGNGPYAVAVADVNLDGKLDLVTANAGAGNLAVLLGKGDGSFTTGPRVPTAQNAHWVAVKDVDGDGLPDLLTVSRDTGVLEVFKNTVQ